MAASESQKLLVPSFTDSSGDQEVSEARLEQRICPWFRFYYLFSKYLGSRKNALVGEDRAGSLSCSLLFPKHPAQQASVNGK